MYISVFGDFFFGRGNKRLVAFAAHVGDDIAASAYVIKFYIYTSIRVNKVARVGARHARRTMGRQGATHGTGHEVFLCVVHGVGIVTATVFQIYIKNHA